MCVERERLKTMAVAACSISRCSVQGRSCVQLPGVACRAALRILPACARGCTCAHNRPPPPGASHARAAASALHALAATGTAHTHAAATTSACACGRYCIPCARAHLSSSEMKSILVPSTCISAAGSISTRTPWSSTSSSNLPLESGWAGGGNAHVRCGPGVHGASGVCAARGGAARCSGARGCAAATNRCAASEPWPAHQSS